MPTLFPTETFRTLPLLFMSSHLCLSSPPHTLPHTPELWPGSLFHYPFVADLGKSQGSPESLKGEGALSSSKAILTGTHSEKGFPEKNLAIGRVGAILCQPEGCCPYLATPSSFAFPTPDL